MAQVYNLAEIDRLLIEKGLLKKDEGDVKIDGLTPMSNWIGILFEAIGGTVSAVSSQNKNKYLVIYNSKVIKLVEIDGKTGGIVMTEFIPYGKIDKIKLNYQNILHIKSVKTKYSVALATLFQGIKQKDKLISLRKFVKDKAAEIKV